MKKPSAVLKKAATTGGLLGAMAIAGGTSAYGDITVISRLSLTPKVPTAPRPNPPTPTGVPTDLTNTAGNTVTTSVTWDVNSDGIIDFNFSYRYPNTTTGSGVIWQANMNTPLPATNNVVSYAGPFVRYAFALTAGTVIGTASPFSGATTTQIVLGSRYRSAGVPSYYGGFAAGPNANGAVPPGTFAYAGFRFNAADGTHFGWIRLATSAGLIDFDMAGYNTTPNQSIMAGQVPEPGTMAMLAMGAAAIVGAVIKRRRA